MKKVIITVAVITTAVAAAHAQSRADVRITSDAWKGLVASRGTALAMASAQTSTKEQKQLQAKMNKVEREIERQNIAHLRAQQEAAEKQAAEENKAEQPAAKKNERHFAHLPATGVMRDYAEACRLAEENTAQCAAQAPVSASTTKKETTPKTASNTQTVSEERYEGSWLGYIGIGPLPNERKADYNLRMRQTGQPAVQPFK